MSTMDVLNMGIMKRSIKECIKLAFDYLNVDKIIMGHTHDNTRCQSLVKRLGFKYEYEKEIKMDDNHTVLGYYYSLDRYERTDI